MLFDFHHFMLDLTNSLPGFWYYSRPVNVVHVLIAVVLLFGLIRLIGKFANVLLVFAIVVLLAMYHIHGGTTWSSLH